MKRKDAKRRALQKGETQRKDGRYVFTYTDGLGKRHQIYSWRLLPTDPILEGTRAGKSLREMEQEVQRDLLAGITTAGGLTVNNLFDRWIKLKMNLRSTTKAEYVKQYDRWIRDGFGALRVDNIKRSDVLGFYVNLMEDQDLSGGTVKRLHCILNQVLEMALNDDLIRKNPAHSVIKDLHLQPKKKEALTADQQQGLVNFVSKSTFVYWLPLIVFLLGTGVRIGEAAGLRWSDLDFDAGLIHIRRSVGLTNGGQVYVLPPKTEAGIRAVPLLPEVEAVLKTIKHGKADGFVFRNTKGGVIDRTNFAMTLKRIARAYNKEHAAAKDGKTLPETISAHIFRHTFATRLREQGVDLKVTQTILGHSKISTTLDIYTDAKDDHIKEEIDQIRGKLPLTAI